MFTRAPHILVEQLKLCLRFEFTSQRDPQIKTLIAHMA
jgi:hypothetical protein